MNQIRVKASVPYDVLIGNGLLAQSGQMIVDHAKKYRKVCVVTDDTVEKLYVILNCEAWDIFVIDFDRNDSKVQTIKMHSLDTRYRF